MSGGEDHELSHAAKAGVALECALDTGQGPAPGADLGIVLGPTVKAILMAIYGAYISSPQTNLCPEGG